MRRGSWDRGEKERERRGGIRLRGGEGGGEGGGEIENGEGGLKSILFRVAI